jgi:universal stress protein A
MATARTYRHVMVALDQADTAHAIAEQSLDLARRYDARLTLLHVVDQRTLGSGGEADVPLFGMEGRTGEQDARRALTEPQPVPFSIDDRLMSRARAFLGAVAEHLGEGRIETLAIASATVGHAIVTAAREHAVDLLVCGAHDRHGLERFLPSPAGGVVHHLPCDLLLVRLP